MDGSWWNVHICKYINYSSIKFLTRIQTHVHIHYFSYYFKRRVIFGCHHHLHFNLTPSPPAVVYVSIFVCIYSLTHTLLELFSIYFNSTFSWPSCSPAAGFTFYLSCFLILFIPFFYYKSCLQNLFFFQFGWLKYYLFVKSLCVIILGDPSLKLLPFVYYKSCFSLSLALSHSSCNFLHKNLNFIWNLIWVFWGVVFIVLYDQFLVIKVIIFENGCLCKQR